MNDNIPPFGGHKGRIFAVGVTADGNVVSGGDDGIVRLWDLRTGRLKRTFRGHDGAVTCLALAPDGDIVLAGSDDRRISVWDVQSGQALAVLSGHSSGVTSVAISSDGSHAASASFDGTIRIWSLPAGEEEAVLTQETSFRGGIGAVAFAPDDCRLVAMPFDGTGQVWDWRAGRQLVRFAAATIMFGNFILQPDQALIGTLAVTSDGKQAVACEITQFDEPGQDADAVDCFFPRKSGAVGIFSLETGVLDVLSEDIPGRVVAAVPTVDGEHIITADSQLAIRIWNRRTGQLEATFGEIGSLREAANCHRAYINALAVTVGGQYIVTGSDDGTVRVWERATGEVKVVIRRPEWPELVAPAGEPVRH